MIVSLYILLFFYINRFPADLEIRKEWVKNINRGEEWSPTQYSRICSAHFEESCFRLGYTRKTLHSHAVPTIFVNHPLSCQPVSVQIIQVVCTKVLVRLRLIQLVWCDLFKQVANNINMYKSKSVKVLICIDITWQHFHNVRSFYNKLVLI